MAIIPPSVQDIDFEMIGVHPPEEELVSIGGIPTPPLDTIAFYDFTYQPPATLLEQVEKESSVTTLRDTNTNIIQEDGSVITYGENTAGMDLGNGMVVEGEATNLLPYSNPTELGWSTVGIVGIMDDYATAPDGTQTASRIYNLQDATGDRATEVGVVATVTNDELYGYIWLKADGNVGDTISVVLKRVSGGSFAGVLTEVTLTDEWQKVEVRYTALVNNTNVLIGLNNEASSTADSCLAWGANATNNQPFSSPIYTNGLAAMRGKTSSQITTTTTGLTQWPKQNFFIELDATILTDFTDQASNTVLYESDSGSGRLYTARLVSTGAFYTELTTTSGAKASSNMSFSSIGRGDRFVLRVEYDGVNLTTYKDGADPVSVAQTGDLDWDSFMQLGSTDGNALHQNINIHSFTVGTL